MALSLLLAGLLSLGLCLFIMPLYINDLKIRERLQRWEGSFLS